MLAAFFAVGGSCETGRLAAQEVTAAKRRGSWCGLSGALRAGGIARAAEPGESVRAGLTPAEYQPPMPSPGSF